MLARLLEPFPEGCFVDVGAGHPVADNVTYWLYLNGWRGINVEPMRLEAELLTKVRPGDITMQVAVADTPGVVTIFEAPPQNRGASTCVPALAEHYSASGQVFTSSEVEAVTLDSILAQYEPRSLHLLKIDIEGGEKAALESARLELHLPLVVMVEATWPNTAYDQSAGWEPNVIGAGYSCVLFDGLNRFYVREDRPDIAELLSVQANVFDGWKPARVAELEEEVERVVRNAAEHAAAMDRRFLDVESYARHLEVEMESRASS